MMAHFIKPNQLDLQRLAQCHRAAFPRALSTAMGQKYVEKMLEWYLVDHRAFIFALEEHDQIIGYCGGLKFDGTARVGSASSMIQHSYNLAIKTFLTKPWLFLHPEFFPKYRLAGRNVFRRIKRMFGIEDIAALVVSKLPDPHTGLIVIGVHPMVLGKGYGSLLLQEFERISIDIGFHKMMLTVRTDNKLAIKSYFRNGWITTHVKGNSTTMEKLCI